MKPDFSSLVCVYDAGKTVVYRGARTDDGTPVLLKSLKRSFPSKASLAELRHEHRTLCKLAELGVAGVVRSHGLLEHDGRLLLATEDVGADSLRIALDQGRWRKDAFLEVAIGTARALGEVHDAGFIHKDINPGNVLWDHRSGQVWLLDFGISVRASRDQARPDALVGTLRYVSPEQTGRMNRLVDSRSDLYSLGAMLYELLTGRPPFLLDAGIELVHAHIAVRPAAPRDIAPDTPVVLSDIVMRLLEKNAEDRYQSAFGLRADLERARDELRRPVAGSPRPERFELGQRDIAQRFQIGDRLYGRERQIDWLLDQFGRAVGGETAFALVSGYSGIGKTALVREVQRPMVRRHGAFLSGKFDQFRRGLPYASLSEALDRFVVQLLSRDVGEQARWRNRIVESTAPNTRLLADVLPHLAALLGELPPIHDLPEAEAENRFNVTFSRFVGALATGDHPLVLFLDDLQWADLPSLRVIERLAAEQESRHLLIVGAYRDNEVGAAHPLTALKSRLAALGRPAAELVLEPLSSGDVAALVAGAHRTTTGELSELAALCHQKTAGNPFFLGQFLTDLHDNRLITFDQQHGRWQWDRDAIIARDHTDNVVEFMAGKVGDLPPRALEVLQAGSVLGNVFDVGLVATALQVEPDALLEPLEVAVGAGFVYLEAGEDPSARFVHDRVQQAAYEGLSPERRAAVHRAVGEIHAGRFESGNGESLFAAVAHLGAARALLGDRKDLLRLARLAVEAASMARAAAAYGPASGFAATALASLDGMPDEHELLLAAHREQAHAAFLTGDYPTMERSIDAVLAASTDVLQKVELLEVRGSACNARNELRQAIDVNIEGLALLGVRLPAVPSKLTVIAELIRAKLALRGRDNAELTQLPVCQDPHRQAAMRLLMNLVGAAYYASPNLIPLLAFRTVRLSLAHGVAAESATGFSVYGLVLCTLGDLAGGYRYGQVAEALASRFAGHRHASRAGHLYNTHIRFWVEPWDICAEGLWRTHQGAYANGDFEYAAFSAFMRCALLAARGTDLGDLMPTMAQTADALREMQQETSGWTLAMVRQSALNLRGGAHLEPWRLIGDAYDERTAVPAHTAAADTTNLFCHQVQVQRLAYLFGRPDLSLEAARAAGPMQEAAASTYFIVETVFYEALARAGVHAGLSGRQARANDRALARLEKRLAGFCAVSDANAGAPLALVRAERQRVAGRVGMALIGYEQAARQAADAGWAHIEGIALERAGRLQLAEGNQRSAHVHLRAARYAYDRWGATALVERLQAEFPQVAPQTSSGDGTLTVSGGGAIDLDAAMRASRAISGQIVLSKLLQSVLTIVVQSAGAQRGVLLLTDDDGEPTLAAATGDDSAYSEGIVRVVLTTAEPVVLDAAAVAGGYTHDPHVRDRQPLSVLCAPLAHSGRMRGVVYLENNLTRGAFTEDRLQLLQLLAAQAAVSLENARLVDNLEQKVRERTRQLDIRNEFIRKTFGRYVSDDIVDALLDQPDGTALGGELRNVTVLMADLRGFSTAVRELPPQQVLALINNFLEVQTRVVMHFGGTIDEVLGDALLVLFGAPIAATDNADRAVACAIAMQRAMDDVNAANNALGLPPLMMGVGIHSGEAVVGNIGTEKRAKYGVVGSVVNLAARVESLTVGGEVLVSGQVRHALHCPIEAGPGREFAPKGAAEPLQVFEVTAIGAPYDLALRSAELPMTTIAPIDIAASLVTSVNTGPALPARLLAVSRERVLVGGIESDTRQNVRLHLPGLPDHQVYGKVIGRDIDGVSTVALTAAPDIVLRWLDGLTPAVEQQRRDALAIRTD